MHEQDEAETGVHPVRGPANSELWREIGLMGGEVATRHPLPPPPNHQMQNEDGDLVDIYIPRKCSYTNRLIRTTDSGAVQFRVAKVDPVTGRALKGQHHYISLSGSLRSKGEADHAINILVERLDKSAA